MGPQVKTKIEELEYCTEVVKKALSHFDKKGDKSSLKIVTEVCDHAYSDPLLFEEFDLWFHKEISDEAFLFQVNHFLSTRDQRPLPEQERNITGNKEAIEKIKINADNETAKTFAKQLKLLAHKKGLTTNEKLGEFLGVSAERARVLLKGEHKPQLETLSNIAALFKVPLEFFIKD